MTYRRAKLEERTKLAKEVKKLYSEGWSIKDVAKKIGRSYYWTQQAVSGKFDN